MPVNDIHQKSLSNCLFLYIECSSLISVNSSICDFTFTFTSSLCPRSQIDKITCKALKVLNFAKRISNEFKLASSLKSNYCALVPPILEYGSVVWDSRTAEACLQLG